jgi:long-chain fatty acid transport protein
MYELLPMTAGARPMSKTHILPRAARPLVLAALSMAVVGALAVPRQADASAFQLKENTAKSMGRAYAGSAAACGDVSVVVNNPAAMSCLKGTYLQADVTAINFSAQFSGTAHDALGRPISGGDGGDAGTTLPVPAFFFATQVGDKLHLGFGFSVPFGFQTEYDSQWMGRYHGIKSKFQSLDATLSASYDVTDDFSLGVSAIAQRTNAELTSAINFNMVGLGLVQQAAAAGAISPAQAQALAGQVGAIVPPGSDGYASIKGDDWAYGWQVGAFWRLTPRDRIAFNYRAKIDHTLHGKANFDVPPNVTALLSSPVVASLLGGGMPFQDTSGRADFTTPATAGVSYWHQADRFGFGIDVARTQWDVFKQLRVDYGNPAQPPTVESYNWRNTWFAAVGGDWYVNDRLTLRGGIAVDSTPTYEKTRSPRVPDSTRKFAAVGLTYQASEHFELSASYLHIFLNNAHVDNTDATGDVLIGNFKDSGNLLAFSAQYKF